MPSSAGHDREQEDRQQILRKAQSLGWGVTLRQLEYLGDLEASADPAALGKALRRALTKPEGCFLGGPTSADSLCAQHSRAESDGLCFPAVFLPRFSPRPIRLDNTADAGLFWERFGQLERLLVAAKFLRDDKVNSSTGMGLPEIRVVCIDGLNAFGERMPTRDEIAKLFDLFRRTGVIGVVTAEAEDSSEAVAAADAMDYLADIVVNLTMEADRGYSVRYLEVVKSRYHHEVYGKHFVRLRGSEIYDTDRSRWPASKEIAKRICALPKKRLAPETIAQVIDTPAGADLAAIADDGKPHAPTGNEAEEDYFVDHCTALTLAHEVLEEIRWRRWVGRNCSGDPEEIHHILSRQGALRQPFMVQPSVHYVVGATTLSDRRNVETPPNFQIGEESLDQIIRSDLKRGSVVAIRGQRGTYKSIIAKNFLLHGLVPKGKKTEKGASVLYVGLSEAITFSPRTWLRSQECAEGKIDTFKKLACRSLNDAKRRLEVFQSADADQGRLYELAVKGGALLPEEMLEFVRDILRQDRDTFPIRRVVLDDVALIGASYPFLRESRTAGDLFLSAFVHVMRNSDVDLVMAGTTGQLEQGDRMVDRACELADTVLTCSYCNVFGDRYVTVTGEGLGQAGMYEGDAMGERRYF